MSQTQNLVVNGDAETGTLAPDYSTTDAPPGWVSSGGFTEVAYAAGSANGGPDPSQSAAIDGGSGFFAGGPNSASSSAYQTIDVSSYAAIIDSGKMNFAASGDFGGFQNQDDSMAMTVTFYGADDTTALGSATLGGVTAADRGDVTEFLYREDDGTVPAGTRFIKVELDATRVAGTYDDGYADNISLTFNSTLLVNGPIVVTATTNYSADTISNVPSITFQTTAASTATFTAQEFGAGLISPSATITGDANADTVKIDLGTSYSFDGSGLIFDNWSAPKDHFTIVGAATGNDVITGTSVGDTIVETTGTGDSIVGGAGNDTIEMGGNFDGSAYVDGGGGTNTLQLNGDYSAELDVYSIMLQNVQKIALVAGHSYNLNIESGVVAAGKTMTIDGATLLADDNLTVDLSSAPSTRFVVDTGAGVNSITLNGAADVVNGGNGSNFLSENGVMSANDIFNFKGSSNYLDLDGNYAGGITFKATTFTDLQGITLDDGFSYKITTNDANVMAGETLSINATQLGATDTFTFNGANETDGAFSILAGNGKDYLTGGAGSDVFIFINGDALAQADHINGGGGYNELFLTGDYSAGLTFGAATMENIQNIELHSGYSYKLTTNDANVAAGQTLTVDGSNLAAGNTLNFNGSKETNGNFGLDGGGGNDTLTGGAGNDAFNGGGGADLLTSNGGSDTFVYTHVGDLTSTAHDTIVGFNALNDNFQLQNLLHAPSAIDAAVTAGKLTTAAFDMNLASAIGANELHVNDAVLFTPTTGNLSGHTFLIVDENGVAGYQAGQDLVIDITGATNLAHFGTGNFTFA